MTYRQDRSTIDTNRWRTRTRRAVAERAEFRCECCRRFLGMTGEADHIVPRSKCEAQGIDPFDLSNLQWLCRPCHSRKTNAEKTEGKPPKPKRRFHRVRVAGRDAYLAAIHNRASN